MHFRVAKRRIEPIIEADNSIRRPAGVAYEFSIEVIFSRDGVDRPSFKGELFDFEK